MVIRIIEIIRRRRSFMPIKMALFFLQKLHNNNNNKYKIINNNNIIH